MKINKKMSILGIIKDYPASTEIFKRYNMSCAGCAGAAAESLEKGARMHGLDPDSLAGELNDLLTHDS